jgi:hypothetical protein
VKLDVGFDVRVGDWGRLKESREVKDVRGFPGLIRHQSASTTGLL